MEALMSLGSKRLSDLDEIYKLIRLYQANECLWNPKSPGYHNLALKENAWERISFFFKGDLTVDQLKLQMLSMRCYYDSERLAVEHNKRMGYHYKPRFSYYEKLEFLKDADTDTNAETVEAQHKLCNGQINCIVEDAFLLRSSQNSIHNEQVDCQMSLSLDEDYDFDSSEPLDYSDERYALHLPMPPLDINTKQLDIRAASGNDRWYPQSNCDNFIDNDDDCHRRQHRSLYPSPHTHNSNYSIISENDYSHRQAAQPMDVQSNDNMGGNANTDWPSPRMCRKVLTGRYRSKQRPPDSDTRYADSWPTNNDLNGNKLQEHMNEGRDDRQFERTQNVRNPKDIARKQSGEERQYKPKSRTFNKHELTSHYKYMRNGEFYGTATGAYMNQLNVQPTNNQDDTTCSCCTTCAGHAPIQEPDVYPVSEVTDPKADQEICPDSADQSVVKRTYKVCTNQRDDQRTYQDLTDQRVDQRKYIDCPGQSVDQRTYQACPNLRAFKKKNDKRAYPNNADQRDYQDKTDQRAYPNDADHNIYSRNADQRAYHCSADQRTYQNNADQRDYQKIADQRVNPDDSDHYVPPRNFDQSNADQEAYPKVADYYVCPRYANQYDNNSDQRDHPNNSDQKAYPSNANQNDYPRNANQRFCHNNSDQRPHSNNADQWEYQKRIPQNTPDPRTYQNTTDQRTYQNTPDQRIHQDNADQRVHQNDGYCQDCQGYCTIHPRNMKYQNSQMQPVQNSEEEKILSQQSSPYQSDEYCQPVPPKKLDRPKHCRNETCPRKSTKQRPNPAYEMEMVEKSSPCRQPACPIRLQREDYGNRRYQQHIEPLSQSHYNERERQRQKTYDDHVRDNYVSGSADDSRNKHKRNCNENYDRLEPCCPEEYVQDVRRDPLDESPRSCRRPPSRAASRAASTQAPEANRKWSPNHTCRNIITKGNELFPCGKFVERPSTERELMQRKYNENYVVDPETQRGKNAVNDYYEEAGYLSATERHRHRKSSPRTYQDEIEETSMKSPIHSQETQKIARQSSRSDFPQPKSMRQLEDDEIQEYPARSPGIHDSRRHINEPYVQPENGHSEYGERKRQQRSDESVGHFSRSGGRSRTNGRESYMYDRQEKTRNEDYSSDQENSRQRDLANRRQNYEHEMQREKDNRPCNEVKRDERKGQKYTEYGNDSKVCPENFGAIPDEINGDKNDEYMYDCCCPTDDEDESRNQQAHATAAAENEHEGTDKPKMHKSCCCETAVETDIDMSLNNRKKSVRSGEYLQPDDGNYENSPKEVDTKSGSPSIQSPAVKAKPAKPPKKMGKICRCTPPVFTKTKQAKSPTAAAKPEICKNRSSSPTGGKSRSSGGKRNKTDDEAANGQRRPTHAGGGKSTG